MHGWHIYHRSSVLVVLLLPRRHRKREQFPAVFFLCVDIAPRMQSSIVDEIACGSESAGDSRSHGEFQTVKNNLKVSIPTLEMKSSVDRRSREQLYVAYFIEVKRGHDSWRVARRFQHFQALQKELVETYGHLFEPLPTRGLLGKIGRNKFDPQYTLERREALERFLCNAISHFDVEECAELDDFLEYSEHMIFFSIDKLGNLEGMQDIIKSLKQVSEGDNQVAAFSNDSVGDVIEDHKDSYQNKYSRFSSSKHNFAIEKALESTAQQLRITLEHMESMREDMVAGIEAKSTVVEMLKKQLEDSQKKSKQRRFAQGCSRSSIQEKLVDIQARMKRLQNEKKILIGEIKSGKQKLSQLTSDREEFVRQYNERVTEFHETEAFVKNTIQNAVTTGAKKAAVGTISQVQAVIKQVHALPKLESMRGSPSESRDLEKAIAFVDEWDVDSFNVKEANGNDYQSVVPILNRLLLDHVSLTKRGYNTRLKTLYLAAESQS
jgi:hypothetical protein